MKKDAYWLGGIAAVLVILLWLATFFYRATEGEKPGARPTGEVRAEASLFVPMHSHVLGPADAKVTIVEFFDPACPPCGLMYPMVKKVLHEHPSRVRLVVRYLPLHADSLYAIGALEAAGEQQHFWEMLDLLLSEQPVWGNHDAPRPELIAGYAEQIGLDMEAFDRFLKAGTYRAIVERDSADAVALGVRGTPTFFVNERRLVQLDYGDLAAMVERELGR